MLAPTGNISTQPLMFDPLIPNPLWRSGVIYMIQLRNEQSAGGLFDSLLAGTSRGR
jgi:hypothetical protein